MNNLTNNTGFKFSFFQIESDKYFYKIRKQKSKSANCNYTINTSDTSESENNLNQNSQTAGEPDKLTLYQNFTDNSRKYVAIKFFLPRSAKAKLILQNPDKTDGIYLINKKLKSGFHTLVTAIRNEELRLFEYYLELRAGRNSDEKKLQYVS